MNLSELCNAAGIKCGFEIVRCADGLLEDDHGTTWFVIARKPLN